MHGLPHAPRHEHGRDLPRSHLVGQRDRRRQDVPGHAAEPFGARASRAGEPQSGGQRAARAVGRPEIPAEDRQPRVQRDAEEHAVRRLPRTWLAVPRRVQARPGRQPD